MPLPERERIGAVYDFVRDRIAFDYNESDVLPASHVLSNGYGQCTTKTTLLMALLRACRIPCRFHGATIDLSLKRSGRDAERGQSTAFTTSVGCDA